MLEEFNLNKIEKETFINIGKVVWLWHQLEKNIFQSSHRAYEKLQTICNIKKLDINDKNLESFRDCIKKRWSDRKSTYSFERGCERSEKIKCYRRLRINLK